MELPIIIKLSYPIAVGEKELIEELIFNRRMTAQDLRGVSATDLKHDEILLIAARMAEIEPPRLKKMDMEDYQKVSAVVMRFFGGGQ